MVVLVGDSIGDGVGEDPTGDGSDGLSYGGAAPEAGGAFYDDDVAQATYPDNAGVGPEPGLVPHIVSGFLAQGFDSVTVYRRAISSSPISPVRTMLHAQIASFVPAGVTVDVLVVVAGTNDADDAGEVATFEATLPLIYADAESLWPSCRVVHVDPIATVAQKPEIEAIRTAIHDTVAARSTRAYVAGEGLDGAGGTVHPTLETYRTQGLGIAAAWEAL